MKNTILPAMACAGLLLVGCSGEGAGPVAPRTASAGPPPAAPAPAEPASDRIKRALVALAARTNDDAWVVFTVAGTEQFVQFAGGAGHGLMLDLPLAGMADKDAVRAVGFFGRRGVSLTRGEFDVYNVEFGDDVEWACEMTIELMREVFGVEGEIELAVEEN